MGAAMNLEPQTGRVDRADRIDLLIHHLRTIGCSYERRLPARLRLEQKLGDELARLLVTALAATTAQGRRGSSSP
jgi:hypothetical protein